MRISLVKINGSFIIKARELDMVKKKSGKLRPVHTEGQKIDLIYCISIIFTFLVQINMALSVAVNFNTVCTSKQML